MAKKKAKAGQSTKSTKSGSSKNSLKQKAVSAGQKLLTGSSSSSKGSSGKRRKKSIAFYAREIARLKLKKRYNKIRYTY